MNKTKTTMIIMIVLLLTPIIVRATTPANLEISVASYNPIPAEPGNKETIYIKVINTGEEKAKNAQIQFVDNYPFKLLNEKDRTQTIGPMGQYETYIKSYEVMIDSKANQGTNYLKIRYSTDKEKNNWVEEKIPLTISSKEKTITINKIQVNPETTTPGGDATISLRVKNTADTNLRDVRIKLDLMPTIIGTTYFDVPIAPISSSSEKKIPLLESGQSSDIIFKVKTYPSAEAGVYKIPITISYTDDDGNNYATTDLTGITINSQPEVMITIDSTTINKKETTGEIIFSVTNKGLDEIKFTTIKLEKSNDYEIITPSNEEYLGNIDSDDYETAEYEIKLKNPLAKKISLPLKVTFKDNLNKDYEITKTLEMTIISAHEKTSNNSLTKIIIILVIIIIGYYSFKKIRRNKKNN